MAQRALRQAAASGHTRGRCANGRRSGIEGPPDRNFRFSLGKLASAPKVDFLAVVKKREREIKSNASFRTATNKTILPNGRTSVMYGRSTRGHAWGPFRCLSRARIPAGSSEKGRCAKCDALRVWVTAKPAGYPSRVDLTASRIAASPVGHLTPAPGRLCASL